MAVAQGGPWSRNFIPFGAETPSGTSRVSTFKTHGFGRRFGVSTRRLAIRIGFFRATKFGLIQLVPRDLRGISTPQRPLAPWCPKRFSCRTKAGWIPKTAEATGTIAGAPEDHMLLAEGDLVYVDFPKGEPHAGGGKSTRSIRKAEGPLAAIDKQAMSYGSLARPAS